MVEQELSLKIEKLEGLVSDLAEDFKVKKEKHKRKKEMLEIILIGLAAAVFFCVSLSFVEEAVFICKILEMFLVSVGIFIFGILKIKNYEKKCVQRARTFIQLKQLKRAISLELHWTEEKYLSYVRQFWMIMEDDYLLWEKNVNYVEDVLKRFGNE